MSAREPSSLSAPLKAVVGLILLGTGLGIGWHAADSADRGAMIWAFMALFGAFAFGIDAVWPARGPRR